MKPKGRVNGLCAAISNDTQVIIVRPHLPVVAELCVGEVVLCPRAARSCRESAEYPRTSRLMAEFTFGAETETKRRR